MLSGILDTDSILVRTVPFLLAVTPKGKPTLNESEPLFWAYGHAVYAAQLLEHGIRLLLSVIDSERRRSGRPPVDFRLDDSDSHHTLGTLFKNVLKAEFLTEAEKRIIWAAVRDRNILVHSYWDEKHTKATLTPKGREWLIADLLRRKDRCRKADSIVSSMIDHYLSQYGTSIDALSAPLFEQWQNDEEPPDEILH